MDFENVNPLNVRLNILSGNLLPTSRHNMLFPIAWRIYSAVIWLIKVIQVSVMIISFMFLPIEKALQGSAVAFLITTEVFFLFARMYTHRDLASRLIQKLNDILCVKDEIMKSIVRATLKPVETPLKFYWIAGTMSLIIWYLVSFIPLFKKKCFYYEDYRMPAVFSKQPFSTDVFLLGNLIGLVFNVYLFMKKVALDIYTINFLLLITAQYRYTAMKLETIFCEGIPQNQLTESREGCRSSVDLRAETEMKALCRHYNAVIHMMPMLKKLLSLNFSLIYLTNVFRFCLLGIMFISTVPSEAPIEGLVVLLYMIGNLVQLYILCLCVHQLLSASSEVTDKAFHEKWYQFGPTLKSTFLLMVIGNNLDCKLSTLENFNLSLPSFMTILNQSYSIALLVLRMK